MSTATARNAPGAHESYDPWFFAKIAAVEDRHFWFCARNRIIAAAARSVVAGLPEGYRFLEAGCGTGGVLRQLVEVCRGGVVTGMDLFPEAVEFASRRASCHVLVGDVLNPPALGEFDAVGMFDVLEHLEDDRAILRGMNRLLKPGGALLLTVPAHRSLWSYFDVSACHCRRYERTDLAARLAETGFRVEYLTEFMMSIFPLVWLGRRLKGGGHRVDRETAAAKTAGELKITPGVNSVLKFILGAEAPLVRRRWKLPLGTSLLVVARKESDAEPRQAAPASKAAPPPARFFAGVAETVVVLLLAMTFLTVNFLTASRSPTAWYDETCMVDPSVSLVLGQGFKSAAWYAQSKEEVWAGYAPLHPLLLGQWLKVVGFSMGKTRSMNYVLVLSAALLLWGASARLGLIAGAWARLALVALVFSGYGITFVYRSGRIDSLHIFLTAAFVFACSLRTAWLRAVLLAFIGIATSLAGYQLIAYAAILVPLAWLFVGRTFWPNAASFVLGGTAGMLLLLGYYTAVGALEKMQTIVGQFFLRIGFPTGYLDYSFLLLSAIALIFALREKAAQRFRWRSPLGFGLVAAVAAPLGVSILGRYPIYYSWMAWLPLAFGFCAAIAAPGVLNRTWERVGATLVVFVVCTIGLPARIALTVLQWNERDYAPVQALAARTVTKADWVYADYPAYYAVKPLAGLTILPPYRTIISDDEKRRVTCLVIGPEDFREVSQILGGKWADTGEAISPVPGRRSFGAVKYNLRVWRRAGT